MGEAIGAIDMRECEQLLKSLQGALVLPIRQGVNGSGLTTLGIGGPVDSLIAVTTVEELMRVRQFVRDAAVAIRILGNGSNVLLPDCGIEGLVVKLAGELRNVQPVAGGFFDVGAAVSLMSLARRVSGDGFSGLEFAAGIPATIGGAIFMNAGAHGAEIGERVEYVEGVSGDGTLRRYQREELPWSYRSSGLPVDFFVTSVRLRLTQGDTALIMAQLAHNLEERKRRQPLSLPSAGSVFKNPSPELPAGKVLELAGLKGARVGGAQVSTLHANWIVNPDRTASAQDVAELIQLCQSRVREEQGIELHPEIRMWL